MSDIVVPRNRHDPVHVVGAAGRIGQAVCRELAYHGIPIIPLVRDDLTWRNTGLPGSARTVDALDSYAMRGALSDAVRVVSCIAPHHASTIIASTEPDALLVLLGDARRYLQIPDAAGLSAMEGERVMLGAGRPSVMLHPTMIYGLPWRDPVTNWAGWLRRLPILPLPDGGRAKLQPLSIVDTVRCIMAALDRNWDTPTILPIGGGQVLSLADFLKLIAWATRTPMPRLLGIPRAMLPVLSPFTALIPGLRLVGQDDLRNFAEDRTVSISAMQSELGVHPVTLEAGLRAMFGLSDGD